MKITAAFINIALLLAIMAIAVFFRFYQLGSIPTGLYPDIAINGNNALKSLETGDFLPFYTDNNGREGMIMWLDAISMAVFGITPLALKIPGAFFGVLTVLGIYLLASELFIRRKYAIALLASFLLATSFWHVIFSRDGFRVVLMPFFLVFSFYFLLRAFNSRKIFPAVLGGIFFGLGFYTYTGYRLAALLLFVFLALWLFVNQKNKLPRAQGVAVFLRKSLFNLRSARFATGWHSSPRQADGVFCQLNKYGGYKVAAVALVATFIIALPLGWYFLKNPGDFIGRAGQTSVFSAPQPLLELGKSLLLHLGMFNFYGDGNWRHNYPGSPELFFPVGLFFLIGIWQAATVIFEAIKRKIIDSNAKAYLFVLLWLIIMLLPGILTYEGVPHALRTLGAIPAVMILAAVGGVATYDWLKSRLPKAAVAGIVISFAAAAILCAWQDYFSHWAKNNNIAGAFTSQFVEIGNLASLLNRQGWQTVIIANENGTPVPYPNGIPMPSQTVQFIEKGNFSPSSIYLTPEKIDQIEIGKKTAIIPMKTDNSIFEKLKIIFPQGIIKQTNNIEYYEINQ